MKGEGNQIQKGLRDYICCLNSYFKHYFGILMISRSKEVNATMDFPENENMEFYDVDGD